MTYPQDIASNTPAPYRFKLLNPDTSESIILTTEPVGWKGGTLEIDREILIGGVFSKFSSGTLTFIKEGAKFLRDIWDSKEINGRCNLHIYWFKFSTQAYIEFPSSFALNFSTIKPRVKVGRFTIGVGIEAVNNDTLTKLRNRENTNIDITKLNSLGGYPIVDYNTPLLPELPKMVYFGNSATSTNAASESTGRYELPRLAGSVSYCSVPLTLLFSEFSEWQNVPHVMRATIAGITPFLKSSLDTYYCNFAYDITIDVTNKDKDKPWEILLIETDTSNAIINEWSIAILGATLGTQYHTYQGSIDLTISSIGNNLLFVVRVSDIASIQAFITHAYVKFHAIELNIASRWLESFPLYNAFERVLQHYLDVQFPFYSEYLSYNTPYTIVYDLDGNVYPVHDDEQLTYFNLFTGLCLRGVPLDSSSGNSNNPFTLNFKKLFHSISAMLNLGYTIEEIAGFTRVRIEEYSYFFDETVVLDLSDRCTIYDIETEAMPELAFQKIKTGYNNFEYEMQNGRGEYNTLHERTTIIKTDSEFDNISDLRADSMKINDLFSKHIEDSGTTDENGDNNIFIIKTQTYEGGWKPETDENIEIENDTSLFGVENSFNLYITPTRNLIRNGNKIKAALTKYPSSLIKYQTSEKLQTLRTTGEGFTITENEDILIDESGSGLLADPIWKPIKHRISVRFDYDDLTTLQSNLFGLIKFSSNIQGYLLNLKKKNDEDMAIIEIIEQYA